MKNKIRIILFIINWFQLSQSMDRKQEFLSRVLAIAVKSPTVTISDIKQLLDQGANPFQEYKGQRAFYVVLFSSFHIRNQGSHYPSQEILELFKQKNPEEYEKYNIVIEDSDSTINGRTYYATKKKR